MATIFRSKEERNIQVRPRLQRTVFQKYDSGLELSQSYQL